MLNSLVFLSRRQCAPPSRAFGTRPCIIFYSARSFLTSRPAFKDSSSNNNGRYQWTSGLRNILQPVEHYLQHGQDSRAVSHFLQGLKSVEPDNKNRFRIYEHVVSLFLRHDHALSAAVIYSRMTAEGFIPSISLRTQMRVVRLAETLPDEFSLLEELKVAFQQKSFEQDDLRDLLNLLVNTMRCTPDFIDRVVRAFLGTRKPEYKLNPATVSLLVRIHATAGSVAAAQNWIADHSIASPQPYTDLLKTLTSADPMNKNAYKWIVNHMKTNNIKADLAFYNVTLALWVSHERLTPVFELYHKLRQHDELAFVPDAYTYGILFGTLRDIRWDREQKRRVRRRVSLPADAPSSRSLFCEMIECHLKHTDGYMTRPSPVLTPAVLDQALRVFMAEEDFAAAFVVVHFLRTLNFNPSLATYHIVLIRLLSRIKREMKLIGKSKGPDHYWTYRFLGLETYGAFQGELPPERSIFEMLTRLGTVARLSLEYIPPQRPEEHVREDDSKTSADSSEHSARSQPSMPSIPVFLKTEPPDPNTVWSTVPLERILRRAILANRPFITYPPAKEVATQILEARAEMFPARSKNNARKWAFRRPPLKS